MAAQNLNHLALDAGVAVTWDYPGKFFWVAHPKAHAFTVRRSARGLRDLLAFLRKHNALEETENLVALRWGLFRMGWPIFDPGDIHWTWASQVNPVWLQRGWYVSLKDWLAQQEPRGGGHCVGGK